MSRFSNAFRASGRPVLAVKILSDSLHYVHMDSLTTEDGAFCNIETVFDIGLDYYNSEDGKIIRKARPTIQHRNVFIGNIITEIPESISKDWAVVVGIKSGISLKEDKFTTMYGGGVRYRGFLSGTIYGDDTKLYFGLDASVFKF